MPRPKVSLKKSIVDYLLESSSIVAITISFMLILYYWDSYPSSIAIHYNALGQADSYGSKWLILIIPFTGLLTYIGMTYLNKFPHIFNFPVEVTENNAKVLYSLGKRLISFMKMIVCLLILYITIAQISSMIFNRSGINIIIILFFVLFLMTAPIYIAVKMKKVGV